MSAEVSVKTLKDKLSDWTDLEVSEHCLAWCRGLAKPDLENWLQHKTIYFSNNAVGNLLAKCYMILSN